MSVVVVNSESLRDLAGRIDQTLLKPEVGRAAFASWIDRVRGYGFATLCVPPVMVDLAAELLCDSRTSVCTVIGFPLGYARSETKAAEAAQAISAGASEVDMVLPIGALLEGDIGVVEDDIRGVVLSAAEASGGRASVKVILETGYLSDPQIVNACEAALAAGADFVKTSTGFGPRGASVADVTLMRASVGSEFGVKASGGIRDLQTALDMLAAGATRLGTSSGIEILEQAASTSE
ncbi:MAG: deoxyribose-phosphate aldolase [Coriobacteriales bacterium]|nr:deoxyribose-phosphate aldolase [Coriobacteriales bacterium]